MTTVAANRSCMAADSKVTVNDSESYSARKIERIGDAIVGAAGHNRAINKFLRWVRRGGGRKPRMVKGDELDAIVLTPAGLFRVDCQFDWEPVKDEFLAIGSGAMAALAAMHCGLNPEGAVEIACRVDCDSAPPVDVLYL